MTEDSSQAGRKPRERDEDIAGVLRSANRPFLTTDEVSSQLSIGMDGTRKRLKALEEADTVRSRTVPYGTIWWHKNAEAPQAWVSDDSTTEADDSIDSEIGVEIVDGLVDIPGRGEVLRARRHAINAAFRLLLFVREVESQELRKTAWVGSTKPTYDDPESLWYNCVYKALDQSPYFRVTSPSSPWKLSPLGDYIANEKGSDVFWRGWKQTRRELNTEVFHEFWAALHDVVRDLFDIDGAADTLRGPPAHSVDTSEYRFGYEFRMDEPPFWATLHTELACSVLLQHPQTVLEAIHSDKDVIDDALDEELGWSFDESSDWPELRVTATKAMDFETISSYPNKPDTIRETVTYPPGLGEAMEWFHSTTVDLLDELYTRLP